WGFEESQYQFSAAFYTQFVPAWTLGWFRASGNILAAFGYLFSHKITQKIGIFKTVFHSIFIGWVVNIIAFAMNNIATPFINTLSGILFGVRMPAQTAVMQQEFSDHQRATMGSVVSLFGSLLFAVGSVFIGWVADVWNPYVAVLTAFALSGFGIPLTYKALKPKK
ncbi:MAG: hypothetical protein FWG18_02700, partial [Alphaproteobacteria bacterium]|nr:hypothetical protein [Alphaproteobacteria bacterium]